MDLIFVKLKIYVVSPRSPTPEAGNEHFLGAGQHLPGGAPEIVIDSVPTSAKPILKVNVE